VIYSLEGDKTESIVDVTQSVEFSFSGQPAGAFLLDPWMPTIQSSMLVDDGGVYYVRGQMTLGDAPIGLLSTYVYLQGSDGLILEEDVDFIQTPPAGQPWDFDVLTLANVGSLPYLQYVEVIP
jgi:hypothetical protein